MKKAIIPALFLVVIITNAWVCNLSVYSKAPEPASFRSGQPVTADTTHKRLKPDEFAALDEYARNTPEDSAKDIRSLAAYLIKPAKNDMEKARLLFTWIATHVKYDVYSFTTGKPCDCTPIGVLKKRRTVCEGYSNLYKELGTAAGLEVEKIEGYAKGYGYKQGENFHKTNHAWNAVKLNNEWKLFDVTWASTYVVEMNGNLVDRVKFEPYWFNVPPKEFVFSHLPEEDKWQLNEPKLNLKTYVGFPHLNQCTFFRVFGVDTIFEDAMTGKTKVKDIVDISNCGFPLKAINVPYRGTLKKGEPVTFIFESDFAEQMGIVEDDKLHLFTKTGNKFSIDYTPESNEIIVALKINTGDKRFTNVATYHVAKKI